MPTAPASRWSIAEGKRACRSTIRCHQSGYCQRGRGADQVAGSHLGYAHRVRRGGREFSTADIHFLEAIASILAVAIDRRQAEDEVRRDRDFAESLIETAEVIGLVLDLFGRKVRWNRYAEETLGLPLEQVRGESWVGIALKAEQRATASEFFNRAPPSGPPGSTVATLVNRAGREKFAWTARALTEPDGTVTARLFIGHDITRLRQAGRRLLESERLAAIGQMVAGLAPRAAMHCSRSVRAAKCSISNWPAEQKRRPGAGVQEAGDRLHRLFEDMRAYAAPLNPQKRPIDLALVSRKAWKPLSTAHHLSATHSGSTAPRCSRSARSIGRACSRRSSRFWKMQSTPAARGPCR